MQVSLEILSGPRAGEKILVPEGRSVTVGRAASANFPLPEDTFLSRVHFEVESTPHGGRVLDCKSANGTSLNGEKLSGAAAVKTGDVISAGQTSFKVLIDEPATAPEPLAAEINRSAHSTAPPGTLAVGSWFFGAIPEGWRIVEDFGLRRYERDAFPSEAMVSEVTLKGGETFERYVQSQLELVRLLVSQPRIESAEPPPISGAEETRSFTVRYSGDGNRLFVQRQIYVRRGERAGALALTTLESELPSVSPFLDQITRGLSFRRLA